MQKETIELIDRAVSGDKKALESLLADVQDMIYNLSLRMLGSPHDAEGCRAGNYDKNHHTAVDLSKRKQLFHMGLPNYYKLSD